MFWLIGTAGGVGVACVLLESGNTLCVRVFVKERGKEEMSVVGIVGVRMRSWWLQRSQHVVCVSVCKERKGGERECVCVNVSVCEYACVCVRLVVTVAKRSCVCMCVYVSVSVRERD